MKKEFNKIIEAKKKAVEEGFELISGEKEFNLSEKIWFYNYETRKIGGIRKSQDMLLTTDVKEFIRRRDELLKLFLANQISIGEFLTKKDKLCGEKLRK